MASSTPRRPRVLACQSCRARRTRCDGEKPSCNACKSRRITCEYPEVPERDGPDVQGELAHLRAQLDRIEVAVTSFQPTSHAQATPRTHVASPQSIPTGGSISSTSPGIPPGHFPVMQIKNSAFASLAGLGGDFGDQLLALERAKPCLAPPIIGSTVFQHSNILSALQSFSEKIHPWYPILQSDFSACISACLNNSFSPGTASFLFLIILASGAIAQPESQREALETRPDAVYLNVALEMMHLVVLEQSLQSVQCLTAASIHYYLLLRPIQAHDLAVLAIKKAQDLQISGALNESQALWEHWVRIYRTILLVEGELVVPIRLSETTAWETEEEIALPTATDTWSFDSAAVIDLPEAQSDAAEKQPAEVVTYLLAEISMRRMLRRNTTSITLSGRGTIEYAPLIARELQAQLQQWYTFLPNSLRFPRHFESSQSLFSLSPQASFLCTQYWACMVSISWPSVLEVIESQRLSQGIADECRNFFYSFRQFIKSATAALQTCLPNKWTILASIFAISIGAYLGASSPALASIASDETWAVLHIARDAFGDECQYSPSLFVMRERLYEALSPRL